MRTNVNGFEEFKESYKEDGNQWLVVQALQQSNRVGFPNYWLEDGYLFKEEGYVCQIVYLGSNYSLSITFLKDIFA